MFGGCSITVIVVIEAGIKADARTYVKISGEFALDYISVRH